MSHVIFDLDGTLIDSAPDLAAALNRVLVEDGRRTLALAEVIGMIGDGAPKLVERALAATGALPGADGVGDIRRRFLAHYDTALAVETRPFPHVEETLARLRDEGWRFAVCTNKPTGPAEKVLAQLALADWFDAIIGPDRVAARKPDPAHVHAVLDEVGARHETAVMVGDSPHDVAAARQAGVAAIAVSYGYAGDEIHGAGAHLVIDSFLALPEALNRLGLGNRLP